MALKPPLPTFFPLYHSTGPLGWDVTSDHNRTMTAISSDGPEDIVFFSLFLQLTRDLSHDSEVLCCSSESGLPLGGVLGKGLDPAPFSLKPRSQLLGENSTLRAQL